jgi:hypothetical protein
MVSIENMLRHTGDEPPDPGLGWVGESGDLEAEPEVPAAHHPVRGAGGEPHLLPVHAQGRRQPVPQLRLELNRIPWLS